MASGISIIAQCEACGCRSNLGGTGDEADHRPGTGKQDGGPLNTLVQSAFEASRTVDRMLGHDWGNPDWHRHRHAPALDGRMLAEPQIISVDVKCRCSAILPVTIAPDGWTPGANLSDSVLEARWSGVATCICKTVLEVEAFAPACGVLND